MLSTKQVKEMLQTLRKQIREAERDFDNKLNFLEKEIREVQAKCPHKKERTVVYEDVTVDCSICGKVFR